ncbi:MAG: hypothetical protein HY904_25015 [Deltaproteobacteria bacterium]|nr:hypothetical protein [Deltaproteobacteria bacterium]
MVGTRWLVLLAGVLLGLACNKGDPAPAKGVTPSGVRLQAAQKIAAAPISIQIPRGWVFERMEGSDAPEKEGPPPGVIDLSESIEVWKATRPSPTGRVDPFVTISVDRRLPKGTTLMKYMETLRADQSRHGLRIKHLDTERIERDGRMGYSVRDSMEMPLPGGGGVPVLQVARIFVNGTTGVTVTGMFLFDDKDVVDMEVRAILESIKFTGPLPKNDTEQFVP